MQLRFNENSKSSRPEGTRAGVTGSDIADTLEAIFAYFDATQKNNPDLLQAIEHESKGWRESVASLRHADQQTLDKFFGQPAPRDVTSALVARGITRENTPDDQYRQLYQNESDNMQVNQSAYWPGCVVPTLDDYRDILAFDAYREKLGGNAGGPAANLVERLDAFEGTRGGKHGALTGLMHATYDYINKTPRDPSETYAAPADVPVDYLNAFHHSYSTYVLWKPSDDMSQVTAVVQRGAGTGFERQNDRLAQEKAKFDAAMERGGIKADAQVKLGKTYGEDAIVVTMSMDDYTKRYLPILRGETAIDMSIPGSKWPASLSTVEVYRGYEPGKKSWLEGEELLVSSALVKAMEVEFPEKRLQGAAEALSFLRNTKSLAETPEKATVAPGVKEDFNRLKPIFPRGAQKVYEFEDTYYSDCDLHNQINRSLSEIDAAVNGRTIKQEAVRAQGKPDTVVFEHNGDTYLPKGDKYYQIALHMQHKYGLDYTWVFRDKEAEKIADGNDKYVISTSQLAPDVRDAALADMQVRLDTEWQAKDLRAATVLRHKIRVGKPLALKSQP